MFEILKDELAFFPLEGQQKKRMDNMVDRGGGSWNFRALRPGEASVVYRLQTRRLYFVINGRMVFRSADGKFSAHVSSGTAVHTPVDFQHRWIGERNEGGLLLRVVGEMSIRVILAPLDEPPHK